MNQLQKGTFHSGRKKSTLGQRLVEKKKAGRHGGILFTWSPIAGDFHQLYPGRPATVAYQKKSRWDQKYLWKLLSHQKKNSGGQMDKLPFRLQLWGMKWKAMRAFGPVMMVLGTNGRVWMGFAPSCERTWWLKKHAISHWNVKSWMPKAWVWVFFFCMFFCWIFWNLG